MPVPASWNGSFKFIDVGANQWFATKTNGEVSMAGPMLCNASLSSSGGQWTCLIGNNTNGLIWSGTTPVQDSPVGVYTRTAGLSATPESINIIGSADPRIEIAAPPSCFPS